MHPSLRPFISHSILNIIPWPIFLPAYFILPPIICRQESVCWRGQIKHWHLCGDSQIPKNKIWRKRNLDIYNFMNHKKIKSKLLVFCRDKKHRHPCIFFLLNQSFHFQLVYTSIWNRCNQLLLLFIQSVLRFYRIQDLIHQFEKLKRAEKIFTWLWDTTQSSCSSSSFVFFAC